jgi:SpoVK/Ycf46/Vps4 family AAA+-type ATPase
MKWTGKSTRVFYSLFSILGKRERPGEHEAMRKIKNEFMSNWDGLKTKDKERVLVLAATNRPFDLDDAVLRRLSRRLLVDLPNVENRVKILKVVFYLFLFM